MTVQRGFTLIEMAIVLVIITILIGGLAMPLSAQIQARRIGETNKTLEEAREAIIGYTMSHTVNVSPSTTCTCVYKADNTLNTPDIPLDASDDPDSTCSVSLCPISYIASATMTLTPPITRHYLPCPDLNGADPEPNLDNDGVDGLRDINNGVEDRQPGSNSSPYVAGSSCAASSGNLPWVTLGVANQDAWGNRLRYAVTSAFSNDAGFSNTDNGVLQVCNISANAGINDCTPGNIASNVVAVVMSSGPNGWGARSVNNTTLANPTGGDERENAGTDHADGEFVSRTPSDNFDDLVKWISADQLRGRICPAGGCP